jgi:hypothetical protein
MWTDEDSAAYDREAEMQPQGWCPTCGERLSQRSDDSSHGRIYGCSCEVEQARIWRVEG